MQKRTFLKSALALGVALSAAPILTACSKAEPEKQAAAQAPAPAAAEAPKLKPIKVAVTAGPHADIVTKAAEVAKKQGFDVKVVEFTDYITPDTALAEKQLDVAVYQHEPFLLNFNKQKGTDLVVAANAVVQPMGLYSNKIHWMTSRPIRKSPFQMIRPTADARSFCSRRPASLNSSPTIRAKLPFMTWRKIRAA